MNILLIFIEIIFCSTILIFLLKKYKYDGIYCGILIFSTLLGIISQKVIEIFGLEINLGFGISALIFTASNIIIQKKGPKEIEKVITIILISNLTMYIFLLLTSLINISSINEISNISFNELFFLNNRTYFASILSLVISLWLNSILYHQIRQIKNKIWISNILTTIVISFIECILFILIAYLFEIPLINLIELIAIRYVFKTIIGLIGTSVIYIANSIER